MTAFNPWNISPTEHGNWLRSLSDAARYPLVGYNFIAGAVPSNAADATNDLSFTAGACVSNNGSLIPITATTKRLDAAFAMGVDVGGAPSGLTISNATYHAFALWGPKSRNSDIGFDSSVTAVNLLADPTAVKAGLTEYCRVFSFYRLAGANVLFTARELAGGGLKIDLKVQVQDYGAVNPGTGAQTRVLGSIPTGIVVKAKLNVNLGDNAATPRSSLLLVTALSETDSTPVEGLSTLFIPGALLAIGSQRQCTYLEVDTNTSASIRTRNTLSDANVIVRLTTIGWDDDRVA